MVIFGVISSLKTPDVFYVFYVLSILMTLMSHLISISRNLHFKTKYVKITDPLLSQNFNV